jgi:hypothetical protein
MLEAIVCLIFCVICCVLAGLCGGRCMSVFGTLRLALVSTPLVVLPILLITGPSRRVEWRYRP